MLENAAIIIFVRHPELGKVKTRLAATIGNEKALAVYEFLLLHTYKLIENIRIPVFIYYADQIVQEDLWIGASIHKKLQQGEDLGEKMANAFQEVLNGGYKKVVIIGSDCYELTTGLIVEAFEMLESVDIVIGPAKDGGYYLLGMKAPFKDLFSNMEWSVATVFGTTMQRVRNTQCSVEVLTILNDVDTEEDINFSYQ